jgi:hypothetical protein
MSQRKNLGSRERQRLTASIAGALRSAQDETGLVSEEQLEHAALETRIKYVELDGQSKPEVIAQAGGEKSGCSPTGNCPIWVLHRRGTTYEILLEADAQTFTVQRTRTRGFLDIALSTHGSAFETEERVYKFNGEAYRESACSDVLWSSLGRDGERHQLSEPRVSTCGAGQ